ncbi:unnamed protein product [Lymnaea stagnalis]|uniref:Cytochrome P450 n=1 Tax=Lymnaea stagnalis TaxID=6523 RepID=A0AAV2HUW7_LYMST
MATRELLRRCGQQLGPVLRIPTRCASTVENVETDQVEARPFRDIPGPRGMYRWPIIGSILLFKPFSKHTTETTQTMLNEMFDQYGPIFQIVMGTKMIVTSDPKDFKTVFNNEGKYPYRPGIKLIDLYFTRNNLKKDVSMLQGEEWHALRAPVNRRLLKADSATHYLEPQNAVADDFVKNLESRDLEAIELSNLLFRYAGESIGVVTFNQRLGFLNDDMNEESKVFLDAAMISSKAIIKSFTGESIAHSLYRNSAYREYEAAHTTLRRISGMYTKRAKEIMNKQKEEGTLNAEEPNLLLSLASEETLSEDDVSNIVLTLYTAGSESTAKNIESFFYNLASNPEKQEILRKEILDIVGPDGPLTKQALAQMSYLKACVKESFRINFPTIGGTIRALPVDVILSGYRVPAGTLIWMFNPRPARLYFDDPDKYIPERWLRTTAARQQETSRNLIVLPFGHGLRNCMGRRFAVQEMYLAATKVLQKMKMELDEDSRNTKFQYKLIIEPVKPLRFKLTKL